MRLSVALLLLLSLCLPMQSVSQNPPPTPPSHMPPPSMSREDSTEQDSTAKLQKALEKKFNLERQAQLKRDTDKLLQLSTELKQYVDKTNENVLSVDVVKKADEIEKLARSVKEKMKGN